MEYIFPTVPCSEQNNFLTCPDRQVKPTCFEYDATVNEFSSIRKKSLFFL